MQQYFWRTSPFLVLLGIAILYWPVNSLGYVWDDITLFLDSPLLRNPESIWVSISTQLLPGTTYFRPVVLLTFIAEFKVFGVQANISHSINYGIFLINCVLVGGLCWRLSVTSELSHRLQRVVLAMLLYGCNPVLLEPVAWVSGRFDLLVTLFSLSGLFVLYSVKGVLRDVLVTTFFLLAVSSKEMAVTFPVLIVVWLWLEQPSSTGICSRIKILLSRRNVRLLFFLFVASGAYLVFRVSLFDGLYSSDRTLQAMDFWGRAAFVGNTIWFYVHMAVWPFSDLSPVHPFDLSLMTEAQKIFGVALAFAFFSTIFLLSLKGGRIGLLLLCALLSLLPVINIAPLLISGNIGQERFLALPVAFLVLVIAQVNILARNLSDAMRRSLPWFAGGLVAGWLILGVLNIRVNTPLWGSEQALWGWAYEKSPESDYVRFNYVSSLLFYQRQDDAEKILEKIERAPSGLTVRMKGLKGQLLVRKQRYMEGLAMLNAGLEGEYQPHEQVLRQGIPLSKVSVVLNGFSSSWYIRFIYGAKAEAYLYLGDYKSLEECLDIMAFYDKNYAVIPMYRAFGAYAQDKIELGNSLFEESLSKFSKPVLDSAYQVRAGFVERYCATHSDQLMCREKDKIILFEKVN